MTFSSGLFIVVILICVFFDNSYGRVLSKESELPVINTNLGQIRGRVLESRLGKPFIAFRGIRYAEAPINDLRFKVFFAIPYFVRIKKNLKKLMLQKHKTILYGLLFCVYEYS